MRTRPRYGRGRHVATAAAREGDTRAVTAAAVGGGDGRAARAEVVRPGVHPAEGEAVRPRSLVMKSMEFYEVNTNIINQSWHSVCMVVL